MEQELLEYLPKDLITHIIAPYCEPCLGDYKEQIEALKLPVEQMNDLAWEMRNDVLRYTSWYPSNNWHNFEHSAVYFLRKNIFSMFAQIRKAKRDEWYKKNILRIGKNRFYKI